MRCPCCKQEASIYQVDLIGDRYPTGRMKQLFVLLQQAGSKGYTHKEITDIAGISNEVWGLYKWRLRKTLSHFKVTIKYDHKTKRYSLQEL